ncbi:hypothetical protein N7453_010029, partial [Penicillium expansum]
MASSSHTIIIPDDEESLSLGPASSRPQRFPRPDYRHQEFENMFVGAINDAPIMSPSRKRKRTATGSSTLDNVFRNVRNTVDHEIRLLRDKNQTLHEELGREQEKRQRLEEEVCREREECRKLEEEVCREREERQKVEGELFRERNRLVLECKICWMQPDHW